MVQLMASLRSSRGTRNARVFSKCSGFHVVRVTNIDVYESLEGVLEMLWRELRLQQ